MDPSDNLAAAGGENLNSAFPIVCIGASAGGLDAFVQLLQHLPPDSGSAFVLIQHLDPRHQSELPNILSRVTRMPLAEVQDGMRVEPDRVYVMPYKVNMTISGGALRLEPRDESVGLHLPINRFLCSLAEDRPNAAIGVILSGTGSDGTLGLQAIKSAGGITFAQDTGSAKSTGMPRSAAATGSVDFVMPPDQIAAELARIGRHPYLRPDTAAPLPAASAFDRIFALLKRTTGVDFSVYRQSTVQRRIHRRMAIQRIAGLEDYAAYLEHEPDELDNLYRDILIIVTRFFRDPEAFAALKVSVFPEILKNETGNSPIRIWVPGCATGEEAYSIAISLVEAIGAGAYAGVGAGAYAGVGAGVGAGRSIQVLASDINAAAVEKARAGIYPADIAEDVGPERLRRFFTAVEGGYQVNKDLRSLCVFARHDLIQDPPYSRLHLISCRNVLIYLGPAQKKILAAFHFALQPNGSLLLGASETTGDLSELFVPTDPKQKIYSRKDVSRQVYFAVRNSAFLPVESAATRTSPGGSDSAKKLPGWQKQADHIILMKYGPAAVVVDESLGVLEIRGQVTPYLELSSGRATLNVLSMARASGLEFELRAAIQTARSEKASVRKEGVRLRNGLAGKVTLQVIPLESENRRTFLILFEETPTAAPSAPPAGSAATAGDAASQVSERENVELVRDLEVAREYVATLLEDSLAAEDAYQAGAQESLSTIEEMQSVNEELETAKEELESTNQELTTVNQELQIRNVELQQSRDFVESIVETVREPLLVLDAALRVNRANSSFYRLFQMSADRTENCFIYDLVDGQWCNPALRAILEQILLKNAALTDYEMECDFPGIGRRTVVFNARRLENGGMILLAIEDITQRRAAEAGLRETTENLRQAQKTEAIGRLAGGVAHDFNNLLTVILGNNGIVLDGLKIDGPLHEAATEVRNAVDRATALTRQLLTFSRRAVLQPMALDLNAVIGGLDKMLRHLLGGNIEVVILPGPRLGAVKGDAGQVAQVIMNLCMNARDAMPDGGKLTIETSNADLSDATARQRGVKPGPYVSLAVSDTGTGMDPAIHAHVFEPFFTTKEKGLGTGIGLATVQAIVDQCGGAIRFATTVGAGTTFQIYLPRSDEPVLKERGPGAAMAEAPRGTETLLLVEDEDALRRLTGKMLAKSGYHVIEVQHGAEALTICEQHQGTIDLLLTDVEMPRMGGRELSERALQLRPGIRVLFMSGYTDDAVLKYGVEIGAPFLGKPFTQRDLAVKVRAALDVPKGTV